MSRIARLAWAEARGGMRALWVVALALAVGVAAMAALSGIDRAVRGALADQGRVILGGDAELTLSHRLASAAELAALQGEGRVSRVIRMRSMASTAGGARSLAELRAVDDAYPLAGQVQTDPPLPLEAALAGGGALIPADLAARLGIAPGDPFQLGGVTLTYRATLLAEPDALGSGSFGFGPHVIARAADLAPLIAPGSFFDAAYRLDLGVPDAAGLRAVKTRLLAAFPEGTRWRDSRRAAPGAARFLDRIGNFLMIASVAGLVLAGAAIALITRDWVMKKAPMVADLRALGASGGQIAALFAAQLAAVALLGVGAGLALGALAARAAGPMLSGWFPVAVAPRLDGAGLALAGALGLGIAALFASAPVLRLLTRRPAEIWRSAAMGGDQAGALPRRFWLGQGVLAAGLIALVLMQAPEPDLAAGALALVAALVAGFAALGALIRAALARLPRPGPAPLRLALAGLAQRRDGVAPVLVALGLGLTLLAAISQMQANLSRAITADLPRRAPDFFVIDIQPAQADAVLARLEGLPGATRVETAPMLAATLTQINGRPAREAAPDHWVLRGDRRISFADALPEGTALVEGAWWAPGHDGPAEVSFSAAEAAELGLKLGDRLGLTVLRRRIEAEITSLREVAFRDGGLGFVMIVNAGALAGAPYSQIATVYGGDLEGLPAALGDWPNVTAISVSEVAAQVSRGLGALSLIVGLGALVVLVSGAVLLIAAALAGRAARGREAAILRAMGAGRGQILGALALRYGLAGALAGICAAGAGLALSWSVMGGLFDLSFVPDWAALALVLAGGMALVLLTGIGLSLGPLRRRPAQVLRAEG